MTDEPKKSRSWGWRWLLPVLISAGLIYWLFRRISVAELVDAAGKLNWPLLILATVIQLLALYVWDAVCLRWLFSQRTDHFPLRLALRDRADSYVLTVVNYESGQALLAWKISQHTRLPLVAAIGRLLLMALHDLTIVFCLGLLGGLVTRTRRTATIAGICGGGLALFFLGIFAVRILPARWRQRWQHSRWGQWIRTWTWRQSLKLCGMRLVFFSIIGVYIAAGLWICGIALSPYVVLGAIPIALLAEVVPSISGLGTRDMTLLFLLQPSASQQAVLISFTLIWSTGLLIGRLAIGLASWWVGPLLDWLRRSGESVHPAPSASPSSQD